MGPPVISHRFIPFASLLFLCFLELPATDLQPGLPPEVAPVFSRGEAALASGDLPAAEKAFREVLAKDPQAVGAYANLGVVYMRQQKWDAALTELHKAEKLAPSVPGIRLNIGLAYYRQQKYKEAISPLQTVVRDLPSSGQAQYLLGLCEFLTEKYADALPHLQAVWDQESSNLAYLYTVAVAADKTHNNDLEEKTIARMLQVGRDSAEMHLFIGKAYVGRNELDKAREEFAKAAEINPRLPFVHYYLGGIARRRSDLPRAKEELLKEVEIDPDVAENWDQLGAVCYLLEDSASAERYYRKAVDLDKTMATAWYGLARIYQDSQRYPEALKVVNAALALEKQSASLHFLKGQVLLRLGREKEARVELAEGNRLARIAQDELARKASGQSMPDPQSPGGQ